MDAEALFLRGKEAADRGNYDYAIQIFRDVLRGNPAHRNSRIALRGCEMELQRNRGTSKLQATLKGIGPLLKLSFTKKPDKVLMLCEDYLVNDPGNASVLNKLATALIAQGHMEAAADTLEFARQRNPDNLKLLERLGDLHHQIGQYDKAIRYYSDLVTAKPTDREASDKLRRITAESHLKKSKLEGASSYREGLRDEEQAKALAKDERAVKTEEDKVDELTKAQKEVEAHPEDAALHLKVGDILFAYERYPEAEAAFRKAFEIGRKYAARERMGNARLRQLEKVEAEAKQQADDSGENPAQLGRYNDAKKKRLEFAIKEFEYRRKQHPTDLNLAWQLGQFLMEVGGPDNIQKAIQQFQAAMNNAGLRLRAQLMLGRCFAMNPKTLDMAKEQFNEAFQRIEDKNTDMGKLLMYSLGEVNEKLNDTAEAVTWYKKIFSIDAGYRDVGKKIQTLA